MTPAKLMDEPLAILGGPKAVEEPEDDLLVGSLGDVAGFSMMTAKSFAIGEAGMLSTDDRTIYERALAFGHYERMAAELTLPELTAGVAGDGGGLPFGAQKFRMNQWCSTMGRVQLKHYPQRMQTIQNAMNRFWDLLADTPGIRPHRPATGSGSTMGGWYNPLGHYRPEELGGLPVNKFIDAVNAECDRANRSANTPLHLHPVLNTIDVYHDGKPTRIAFADRDLRQARGSLPVSEQLHERCLGVPWFKHDRPASIERYAAAFRKVALQADKLTG